MTQSMTGFGRGEIASGNHIYTVEVKSVNSRYCEVKSHCPRDFIAHEAEVSAMIRKRFNRGRFDVFIQVADVPGVAPEISIDRNFADHIVGLLGQLKKRYQLTDDISLNHLLMHKDLFRTGEQDREAAWAKIAEAMRIALDGLEEMRIAEGKRLVDDIVARQKEMEKALTEVESRREGVIKNVEKRLLDRIDRVLSERRVDKERIEQEVAFLIDRSDVTEELVRLASHMKRLTKVLAKPDPKGRELDFLIQEFHREINTLGQKSQDSGISEWVIQMKSTTEKIREQVQNIE